MKATLVYRSRIIIKAIRPFVRPGDTVLDVGCGNCVVSAELQRQLRCRLTGTDILEYCKADVAFMPMSSPTRLDLPNASYDVCLFNDVLHHMPLDQQVALLREALRVGGKVLVFEVRPGLLASAVDKAANMLHNICMPTPCTFRTPQQWAEALAGERCSVTSISLKKPTPLWPFSNFLLVLEPHKD